MVTLLVAASVCPSLRGDDEAQAKKAGAVLVMRIEELNLTDDQEAKIAEIRKEFQPKVREAAQALAGIVKDEEGQVGAVLTDEQKEKTKEFKEERKEQRQENLTERLAHLKELDLTEAERAKIEEIRKEYHPKIVAAMEGLKGILNEDQKKGREEGLKAGKKHREIVASLNLTDEQKEKVQAVCKEVASTVREELEKIRDVLTEEQQAKLPELKEERQERVRDRRVLRIVNLKELNLTDEQRAKIHDIRKEFQPKVHQAGNKFRELVREEIGNILAIMKG
jgi:Spy/CpxP family protein refolding chaperone